MIKMKKKTQYKLLQLAFSYGSRLAPRLAAKKAAQFFASTTRFDRPTAEIEFLETAKQIKFKNIYSGHIWGETGPYVLLVHGWNGRGSQMGAFARPLVEKGFRVIAFDGPAHGDSPGNESNPGEYADFIVGLQNEFSPVHAVIAHSFGSGCAVLAAKRGLRINKIVLIACPARYEDVCRRFAKTIGLTPKAEQSFMQMIEERVGLPASALHIAKLGNETGLPVLIVHDTQDKDIAFKNTVEFMSTWKNARLLKTEGLGHRRILKDPSVINTITEFVV